MVSADKFILLGHPRSGSTLVTLALQAHPDIRMFGELFHEEFQHRLIAYGWGIRRRPSSRLFPERTKGWCYTEHQEGDRFLDELVFGDTSEDRPRVTGFKLFYRHARSEPRARSAWDYLRRHEDVMIVHLVRENLLDCLLSIGTAERTEVWQVEAGDHHPPEPPPVAISPDACRAFFEEIGDLRRRAASELFSPGRRILDIEYSRDVLGNFDGTLHRIQEFLGVEPIPVPQLIEKQSTRAAHERIENYHELRRHFEGTPFGSYFNDNGRIHG